MKPLNQLQLKDIVEYVKSVPPRIWGYAAAGILLLVALVSFILIPAWVTRFQIRGEIKRITKQMAITQNLLKKQTTLIKNKELYLKVSKDVKARLFNSGETSLLLGMVSRLAQESKVSVVSSSPKKYEAQFPPPFDEQYQAQAYLFTVEGGYHEIADFVSKIENNPKVLRIQTFTLIPQDKTPDKHLADVEVSAVSKKAMAAK